MRPCLASTLAAGFVACQVAFVGLVLNDTDPRRVLLEVGNNQSAMVAQIELLQLAVGQLKTAAAQTTIVQNCSCTELQAQVKTQDGIIAGMKKNSTAIGARLLVVEDTLKAWRQKDEGAWRRRQMQGAEPEPEPAQGETVYQFKIDVTRIAPLCPLGSDTNDGHFDKSYCEDPAFERCHREACVGYNGDHSHPGHDGKGHRRAQAARGCQLANLADRTAEVTAECCDEPGENCDDGTPLTCNAGCAAAFLPFWVDCESALDLGPHSTQFEAAVELCRHRTPSLAEQLNVECTDGTPEADCVARCAEEYHGYQLMLNIDGEDSKMSCELHHELYSWVGGATDGGYLGSDIRTFVSAVFSGAAGVYIFMLDRDAGISALLTVTPGQSVSVTGDPSFAPVPDGPIYNGRPMNSNMRDAPLWGTGSFVVQERSSLALTRIALDPAASIAVGGGGSLSLASMIVPEAALPYYELYGVGSTLRLAEVVVAEYRSDDTCTARDGVHCRDGGPNHEQMFPVLCILGTEATDCGTPPAPPPLTGTIEVIADEQGHESWVTEGSLTFGSPVFRVTSGRTCTNFDGACRGAGTPPDYADWHCTNPTFDTCLEWDDTPPCAVSEGGRCVGRPEGYGPNEECTITIGGTGASVLGPCAVFDIAIAGETTGDYITLASGAQFRGSDCPLAALMAGDALSWHSNNAGQGSVEGSEGACPYGNCDNGCVAKGTCGLPWTYHGPGGTVGNSCGGDRHQACPNGLGGGWELCFASAPRRPPRANPGAVRGGGGG